MRSRASLKNEISFTGPWSPHVSEQRTVVLTKEIKRLLDRKGREERHHLVTRQAIYTLYSVMRRRQRGGKCPTSPHRAGGEEAVVSFNLFNPNPNEGRSSHGVKAEDDPRKKGTRKRRCTDPTDDDEPGPKTLPARG